MKTQGERLQEPGSKNRARPVVAIAVYALGLFAVAIFAYRNLVVIPADSWLDFVFVGLWAVGVWWITAGVAARLGWGPREVLSKFKTWRTD